MITGKRILALTMSLLGLTLICSCATTGTTLPLAVAVPTVALDHVEVDHYWGYWYISQKTEPTKGKLTANVGAPLDLAFIFAVTNPNPFPVQMEHMQFTIAFEDFELNTVTAYETMWIPPKQTNQYRVHAMFDVATSFLSLGVTGGFKLEEKKISAWDQLEKWWTGIPSFAFPIQVRNGTASFKVGDKSVISPFTAVYPPSTKQ